MNFLVDAQLPRRLTRHRRVAGHDALQTLDLPSGNRTTDHQINDISVREQRVVVTKDEDFVSSYLLAKRPYKLLLVSTGNIRNADLDVIFIPNIPVIASAFDQYSFIELTRTAIIIHE